MTLPFKHSKFSESKSVDKEIVNLVLKVTIKQVGSFNFVGGGIFEDCEGFFLIREDVFALIRRLLVQ